MTMPKLKAPKLTFDQAIVMLPKKFQPVERASYHRHKLRANSPMGIVAFSASKEHNDEKVWWTSVFPPEDEPEITFWIIALDIRGILVLPIGIVDSFCKKNNVPKLSSGKWSIHLKMEEQRILMYYTDSFEDVSQYFISSLLS